MPTEQLDRRTFLAAGFAACACAACPLAARAKDGGGAEAPPAAEPVDVGTAADYSREGAVYGAFAKSHGFFLVRDQGKLYALGSACTHKKTLLKAKDKAIVCPKHGARFDIHGDVTKAPARRPLPRYGITRDDAGRISVDSSRVFEDDARDEEASQVSLD